MLEIFPIRSSVAAFARSKRFWKLPSDVSGYYESCLTRREKCSISQVPGVGESRVCHRLFRGHCQGQQFHRRQSTIERERAWKAGFHTVQLLQFWIILYSEKGDHHDDTEFIPRNASVIAVMEHISFTVSEWINSAADSVAAHLISHTWLFTWAPTDREWRLIKRLSTTYSYGMYILVYRKVLPYSISHYSSRDNN